MTRGAVHRPHSQLRLNKFPSMSCRNLIKTHVALCSCLKTYCLRSRLGPLIFGNSHTEMLPKWATRVSPSSFAVEDLSRVL